MDTQVDFTDFAVVREVSPRGARAGHETKSSPRLGQSMLYTGVCVCMVVVVQYILNIISLSLKASKIFLQ